MIMNTVSLAEKVVQKAGINRILGFIIVIGREDRQNRGMETSLQNM
jgi:hypothetical protein